MMLAVHGMALEFHEKVRKDAALLQIQPFVQCLDLVRSDASREVKIAGLEKLYAKKRWAAIDDKSAYLDVLVKQFAEDKRVVIAATYDPQEKELKLTFENGETGTGKVIFEQERWVINER